MRHRRSELDANRALKAGIRRPRIAPTPRRRYRVLPVLRVLAVIAAMGAALHFTQLPECRDNPNPPRVCMD